MLPFDLEIMNSHDVIERCEHIADISSLMLAAARSANWREVERLRDCAGDMIDEVRLLSGLIPMSVDERREKLAALQRILDNDGQIRELSEPWLRYLSELLHPETADSAPPMNRRP